MSETFLKRIFTKPPILFPLVALFHLMMLCYSIWNYKEFSFPSVYWLPSLWLLIYLISWLFICDLKRWAALLYIALTILNVLLHYILKYQSEVSIYTAPFFVIYILFSFFALFYYRKLQ